MDYKTKYIGIYLHNEKNHWWLFDSNGNEMYCGTRFTDQQVEAFRKQAAS